MWSLLAVTTCFVRGQVFHKQPSKGKPLVSDPRMRQTGNRTGRLNNPREW